MPSLGQKVDILFKKFIAYKALANIAGGNANSFTPSTTPYDLESYGSKMVITADQVWTESRSIPALSNHLNKSLLLPQQVLRTSGAYIDTLDAADPDRPIIKVNGKKLYQRLDLEMDFVAGTRFTWKYKNTKGSAPWIADFGLTADFINYNILPFSYDDSGTIYRYELYSSKSGSADPIWGTSYTLGGQIPFGFNDWFFDPDSSGLLVNFLSETLPSGVTTGSTLYLRCYRYIGDLGVVPGVINPGNNVVFDFGDWQDSVYDFVTSLPLSPGDGERYIANGLIPLTNVYDVIADSTTVTSIPSNSIVHYWDNVVHGTTNGGWIIITPQLGMFTSADQKGNNLVKWDGFNWVDLNWMLSKDFKIESPTLTTQDGEYTGISPLINMPAGSVSVEVKVNGIDTTIGDGCTAATFLTPTWSGLFAKQYNFISATGTTVVISGVHDLAIADALIINDNGVIKCFDITLVSGNTITISSPLTGPVTSVMHAKKWGNIKAGDILLWFGSNAGYQLDPADDKIVFKYITHN
jgi:hypothetical protein